MKRWPALFLSIAPAVACSRAPAIPDHEILLHIDVGAPEVEFGKAFPLTVVRAWSKELVPEDWNDQSLTPLVARLVETTLRENDHHVEETRQYECFAFSLTDITVPAPSFRAKPRAGGVERVALGEELKLKVRPSLDRATPGPPELPGDPLPAPRTGRLWWWSGAVVLTVLALYFWSRRSSLPPQMAPYLTPKVDPHGQAVQRLEQLGKQTPQSPVEVQRFHEEAAALLREYIEARFSLIAPPMTTEEFLSAPRTARSLVAAHQEMLTEFLLNCDRVKFGRDLPSTSQRQRLLQTAAHFLHETQQSERSRRMDRPA